MIFKNEAQRAGGGNRAGARYCSLTNAGQSITNVVLVIGLLDAPIFARVVRAELLALRGGLLIESARAIGNGCPPKVRSNSTTRTDSLERPHGGARTYGRGRYPPAPEGPRHGPESPAGALLPAAHQGAGWAAYRCAGRKPQLRHGIDQLIV